MKVEELRAALEAAGVEDAEGTKPVLVERLVAAQRAAPAAPKRGGGPRSPSTRPPRRARPSA